MVGVKVEHVLILVIVAFVIYHLFESCGCTNGLVGVDGFSVGIETSSTISPSTSCNTALHDLCYASRQAGSDIQEGSDKCRVCAGVNQHALRMAGCEESMIDSFCWNNLPSCPLTEDPDDVMFPFSYNPKCGYKFDKHVYSKQYTFDGRDYYKCEGFKKFLEKCKPTKGQIIPRCNKDLTNNCDKFKDNEKECNNKSQFSDDITIDGKTIKRKVNCNNFLYGTKNPYGCYSRKDSGILDPYCVEFNCTGGAGPNRQNILIHNWCYE